MHAIISLAFIITELFFFMDKRDIYEKFNNFEILKSIYSHVKSISASTLESLFRFYDLMLTSVEKTDSHKYVEENGNSTCKALYASRG